MCKLSKLKSSSNRTDSLDSGIDLLGSYLRRSGLTGNLTDSLGIMNLRYINCIYPYIASISEFAQTHNTDMDTILNMYR